jgi:Flp pilus assembly protein TadD
MQTQEGTSAAGFELEGDMLMAQKKNDAALKAYEQAFSRDKRAPMLIKVHETLKQSGRQDEANVRVARWIKTNPKDTLVRMHIGTSSLLKKENTAAIEQFQAILQQDPNHVPALNNLALAYQQEKDPRALGYAEKAYELAQENPVIMDTLGWMLVEQGNVARGLPLLQKAASSATAALDTRYHLAAALAKSGDSAAARKELNQLLDAGKTFAKMDEAKALRKQLQ